MKTDEYIICAAIWFNDGKKYVHQPKNIDLGFVISGRRHHNCFITFSAVKSVVVKENGLNEDQIGDYPKNIEQGFLTSKDRFINRQEAAELALVTLQIDEPVKILFSEHLY
jgi:hypothetical protein